MRVLLVGATGTIGQATARALARHGHEVVCFARRSSLKASTLNRITGVTVRMGEVTDAASVTRDAICGERFDAVVSCLASRTGVPRDAWAVDYRAQVNVLNAAKAAGVSHFVLLSAICVQKPRLEFQRAKRAFEDVLARSGCTYSIVRATAFFKSLAGQVERVRAGKPYLVFGDGTLTACKPISDDDLAEFLAGCLTRPDRRDRIIPIGGPGPALTPRAQAEQLFALVGRQPAFTRVPVVLLDVIIGLLGVIGRVIPSVAAKAELARIGRYYATESMLVWDEQHQRYDADATPEHGSETLSAYFARLLRGDATDDRGAHAVF